MGVHSILLQWILTVIMKLIQRHIIWSLCYNLKWCFWMRTHTRRWRVWEWNSHSSMQSTQTISHINTWKLIFQSCYTTYLSRSTSIIQKPLPSTPPFDIQQFWQREPCENKGSTSSTPQTTKWQLTMWKSRIPSINTAHHELLPSIST